MKIRWMTMVFGGLLLAGCGGKDEGVEPPTSEEEFVEALAFAVNSKDIHKFKQLIHPKCLAAITDETRPFMDRAHVKMLQQGLVLVTGEREVKPIPEKERNEEIKGLDIPVRPTHALKIDILTSAGKVVPSVHLICVEDGKWWVVQPIPTAETIAKINEAIAKRKRPTSMPAAMREKLMRGRSATRPTTGVARTRPARPARPGARTRPGPRPKAPTKAAPTQPGTPKAR